MFYSMNVKLLDMFYVVIECCLVWGGSLKFFNVSQVKVVFGVVEVIEMEDVVFDKNMDYKGGRCVGVVILVENIWVVMQVKKVFEVEWDFGGNSKRFS